MTSSYSAGHCCIRRKGASIVFCAIAIVTWQFTLYSKTCFVLYVTACFFVLFSFLKDILLQLFFDVEQLVGLYACKQPHISDILFRSQYATFQCYAFLCVDITVSLTYASSYTTKYASV